MKVTLGWSSALATISLAQKTLKHAQNQSLLLYEFRRDAGERRVAALFIYHGVCTGLFAQFSLQCAPMHIKAAGSS